MSLVVQFFWQHSVERSLTLKTLSPRE